MGSNGGDVGTGIAIGIVGCGRAAAIHSERLSSLEGVRLVGFADPDPAAARELATRFGVPGGVFGHHNELLAEVQPHAVAVFTPHRSHYGPTMDALQAGCHVFVEKPLSTNAQEAADIARLAEARGRIVAVGHQFRLCPSLEQARERLQAGAVGELRLVTATLAAPWLASHSGPEDSWRLDPRVSGGGIVADSGDHLLDALLWTTGREAVEVAAFQSRIAPGLDVVTAASVRLEGEALATLAISGVSSDAVFELTFHGESGRLVATDRSLAFYPSGGVAQVPALPAGPASIDSDFISAIRLGHAPRCTAREALATVRLLEAIGRSASGGQIARVV